MSVLF
jgi:short-subunit dehydrogenase